MGANEPIDVSIVRAFAITAGDDGVLDDAFLARERRSRKVGNLPAKSRMVLEAARHCLPPSTGMEPAPGTGAGVSLGTLYGSMDAAEACLRTVYQEGFSHVLPSWYATGLPNATTAILASVCNLGGPNLTFVGHQAGLDAIIGACRQIVCRRAVAMLAGGFDMPSMSFNEKLAARGADYAAKDMHPGAGLLWLSERESADAELARIIGWSQNFHAGSALSDEQIGSLVNQARSRSGISAPPTVHVIYPGVSGKTDYLAATAPILLIKDVIHNGAPGPHAVIAKGMGPSVACLLVQKP